MREIGIKGVDGEHHLSIIRVHENLVHYPSNNISSILKHQGGGGGRSRQWFVYDTNPPRFINEFYNFSYILRVGTGLGLVCKI